MSYTEDSQQVAMAVLHLKGLKLMVIDSYLVTHILEGGLALMPLDNYGFSKKIVWIQDRFGVS